MANKLDLRRRMLGKSPNNTNWKALFSGMIDSTISGDVVIPSDVTYVATSAFRDKQQITGVIIHDQVTSLYDHAFNGCIRLTKVEIGTGITSIGVQTFYKVPATFIIKATTPPTIGNAALTGSKVVAIYVPDASVDTYKAANGWSAFEAKIFPISELDNE